MHRKSEQDKGNKQDKMTENFVVIRAARGKSGYIGKSSHNLIPNVLSQSNHGPATDCRKGRRRDKRG